MDIRSVRIAVGRWGCRNLPEGPQFMTPAVTIHCTVLAGYRIRVHTVPATGRNPMQGSTPKRCP
jgi:hypothetical protein